MRDDDLRKRPTVQALQQECQDCSTRVCRRIQCLFVLLTPQVSWRPALASYHLRCLMGNTVMHQELGAEVGQVLVVPRAPSRALEWHYFDSSVRSEKAASTPPSLRCDESISRPNATSGSGQVSRTPSHRNCSIHRSDSAPLRLNLLRK